MNPRQYLEYLFANSSCHGGVWVGKVDNLYLKAPIGFLLLWLQFAVVYMFISTFLSGQEKGYTLMQWENSGSIEYPNITICNPRMFDKAKTAELNISPELLTYIYLVYAFDSASVVYHSLKDDLPKLKIELDDLMQTHNISNVGFHLAIKCEDFFVGNNFCTEYFDSTPRLSSYGTCFTTKKSFLATIPGPLDARRIVLNSSLDYTAEFSSHLQRRKLEGGIYISFHRNDHPLVSMGDRGFNLPRGSHNKIGLSVVINNQSSAEASSRSERTFGSKNALDSCVLSTDQENKVLKGFGYPMWSQKNCNDLLLSQYFANCSVLMTRDATLHPKAFAINAIENLNLTGGVSKLRLCTSNDYASLLERLTRNDTDIFQRADRIMKLITENCNKECEETSFTTEISTTTLENVDASLLKMQDEVSIIIYFTSLTRQTNQLIAKTVWDRISNTGGTVGLILGASLVSIVEIIIFYIGLAVVTAKTVMKKAAAFM